MSLTLVVGNTYPILNGTITDATGVAVNLTSASVKFQLRESSDYTFTINAACTIVNAALGQVSYTLAANDLNRPGTYLACFQVTYAGGQVQTTDPPVTIVVRTQ
jgi:hypothetical protein